ncbi:MAG: hypothetical protein ACTSO7_16415 [Candidatus Heimdallarchaeota archaeon]
MRKEKNRKSLILYFIFCLLLFTNIFLEPLQIKAQANLVEENDRFIIYSGNNFDLIIPKEEGPSALFDINGFGEISYDINYLSEYQSTSIFMNSLNNLFGKGYSLSDMEWSSVGSAETSKTYVNFTRSYLDSNTTISTSFNIFNQAKNISGYEIEALTQAYVEFRIKDWEYTPDAKGLAINLITFQKDSDDYTRFGPYLEIDTLTYVAKIISSSGSEFFIKFKPYLTVITDSGIEEYESMFFANYNVAAYDSKPADFWISIPARQDIKEIIFSFFCYYTIGQTSSTAIEPIISFTLALVSITIIVNVVKIRRRKE